MCRVCQLGLTKNYIGAYIKKVNKIMYEIDIIYVEEYTTDSQHDNSFLVHSHPVLSHLQCC